MRFSEVLAASLVAPLVAAHAVPGVPRIYGLPQKDIAALKARSIFGGHVAHRAAHASHLQARQEGGQDGRCGKDFGCASCAEGYCCSPGGYCGQGDDYCMAPDSLFDYGPGADANKLPAGGSTRNIARPKLGNVDYGGDGIYSCVKPGQFAMTYDDGPYIYTNEVLDMFKAYNFKATFFVTGNNNGKGAIDDESKQWPSMLRRMLAEGHQIASHTWSHQDLSAITKDQRYEQMIRNEMAISNVVGKFPTYMRPPYSSCTAASGCEQDLADLGYHVSYFDLDTDDYNNLTPALAQIPKNIVKKALDASNPATSDFLVIAHDIHEQSVRNLTVYILDQMSQKGYKGVTMGECMGDPESNWYRSGSRVATSSVFTPPACASTRASSTAGTATSSGAVATATGVSPDGSCGTSVGFTCAGSGFGNCCSQYGYCGSADGYCGDGCQKGFGNCGLSSASPAASSAASTGASASSSAAGVTSAPASSAASSSPVVASSTPVVSSKPASSSPAISSSKPSPPGPGTPGTPPPPPGTPPPPPGTPSGPSGPGTPPPPPSPPTTTKKPSSTSTAAPQPTGKKTLFGTCGRFAGTNCIGWIFGECCSQWGTCGSGAFSCGSGCQKGYGKCN